MSFATPWLLLLLVALPLIAWLGWPRHGIGRVRAWIGLGLRLAIALLLILGMAGLEVRNASDRLAVVFLLDASDSMTVPLRLSTGDGGTVQTTPYELAQAYVRDALSKMDVRDEAGVIVFGGDAAVERGLSTSKEFETPTVRVTTLQTDLAGAVRLGLAVLPTDAMRRLVILSDGLETSGDALEAARLASTSGAQIMVVPFSVSGGAEALLTSVQAPSRLRPGEEFGLSVRIESTLPQTVGVRVLAGNAIAYEGQVELRRGTNNLTLPLKAGQPGFTSYRVQITAANEADTFYQNNELSAFTQVTGPPRLLLINNPAARDGIQGDAEILAALQATGLTVDVRGPEGLPTDLPSLAEYASVILVDVPARSLTQRQMDAVETYVRDLGGGLIAVGGPTSFGVGGYFDTPLERALPVDMQIKDEKRRARVTMLFVIDHSGSMSETSGGVTKLDLAKEAVIRSVELLSPQDRVGVIVFDDVASVAVPITSLENPDAIINQVGTIGIGGGTDIMAGVRLASETLPQDDSAVRHIVLLTDGGADPTGIAQLIEKMYTEQGITLSSVGVGQGAAPFLPDLAKAGGGVYHFAGDPSQIPSIFTEETTLATRAYIIEQTFFPRQASASPILSGIDSVPQLLGYIGTTAKEAAQVVLVNPDSPNPEQPDPILATWQYGLGRSVAWTSDATGRWAQAWAGWDQFARFWSQAVRYAIGAQSQAASNVQVQSQGDVAQITVDAQNDSGDYLNDLEVLANVVGPDGTTQTVTLRQTGPGRYTGDFAPTAQGAYLVRVTGTSPNGAAGVDPALSDLNGWVLSYSPEYAVVVPPEDSNVTPDNIRFLQQLAAVTGGTNVTADAARIFIHDLPAPPSARQPIWPWLLLAAALLLPFDIAVRRLSIGRYELRRLQERARALWARTRRPAEPAPLTPERASQLDALRRAKERAGESASAPPPIVTDPTAQPFVLENRPRSEAEPSPPATSQSPAAQKRPEPTPPPVVPPSSAAASGSEAAGAGTSAALLARKRARQQQKKP